MITVYFNWGKKTISWEYVDMGCIEIIDCRAFGEVDFVKYITSKPIMRGYQLQYKNRTFLNW